MDPCLSTQKDANDIALSGKASDKEYAEYNPLDVISVVWGMFACIRDVWKNSLQNANCGYFYVVEI